MPDTILELKSIKKSFDGKTVLEDMSVEIYRNEFITVLGPSGWVEHSHVSASGDSSDVLPYSVFSRSPPQR